MTSRAEALEALADAVEDVPVIGDWVSDLAPEPEPSRHWLRRLLLLALVGAAVAWFVRSRQSQPPELRVVPPPSPSPRPATPPPAPEVVPDPEPTPVAQTVADPEPVSPIRTFSSPGAVVPGNHAGSAQPLPTGAAPGPEYVIKGNEQSMIYHTPDSPSYGRTIAEVWFASEDDAVAAGFRPPKRRTKKDD